MTPRELSTSSNYGIILSKQAKNKSCVTRGSPTAHLGRLNDVRIHTFNYIHTCTTVQINTLVILCKAYSCSWTSVCLFDWTTLTLQHVHLLGREDVLRCRLALNHRISVTLFKIARMIPMKSIAVSFQSLCIIIKRKVKLCDARISGQ